MNFYKLLDTKYGLDVYINPKYIQYYVYHDTSVEIYLHSKKFLHVDKSDFTNMLILEGVNEYWSNNLTWLIYYYIIN